MTRKVSQHICTACQGDWVVDWKNNHSTWMTSRHFEFVVIYLILFLCFIWNQISVFCVVRFAEREVFFCCKSPRIQSRDVRWFFFLKQWIKLLTQIQQLGYVNPHLDQNFPKFISKRKFASCLLNQIHKKKQIFCFEFFISKPPMQTFELNFFLSALCKATK